MRLIDADALKRNIEQFQNRLYPPDDKSRHALIGRNTIYGIMRVINEQPTDSQWIPMEKELPKDEENCLVTRTDGVCTWVEEGEFVIDRFCFIGDEYLFNTKRQIIEVAWLPLPAPYKGGKNE